jgi:hypothetical protein
MQPHRKKQRQHIAPQHQLRTSPNIIGQWQCNPLHHLDLARRASYGSDNP